MMRIRDNRYYYLKTDTNDRFPCLFLIFIFAVNIFYYYYFFFEIKLKIENRHE